MVPLAVATYLPAEFSLRWLQGQRLLELVCHPLHRHWQMPSESRLTRKLGADSSSHWHPLALGGDSYSQWMTN